MRTATKRSLPVSPVRTILLVEDDPAVRETTRQVLELAGYRVVEASCAEEAMQIGAAPDFRIDLLVTDFVMRRMDGLVLARNLKLSHPDLITIVMSGYAERDIVGELAGEAGTIFLRKPFSLEGLCGRLHEARAMGSAFNSAEPCKIKAKSAGAAVV